jgi:GDP-4-dehydro-6-deoxy-D-mannose reductase
LLEALKNMSRIPLGVESDPERMRPMDIPYLVGDRRKITVGVDWAPKRTLAETLETLLEDWRARTGVERAAGERA